MTLWNDSGSPFVKIPHSGAKRARIENRLGSGRNDHSAAAGWKR